MGIFLEIKSRGKWLFKAWWISLSFTLFDILFDEFLSKYNLKLEFDWSTETPALYEIENGKSKLIKHIVSPEVFGVHYEIPFQFREFRSIDLNDFLEKDFDIEPGMIFIVSNSINEFQAANGEKKYPYQILPSEVYNLLDLVSQPLEKEK